MFETKLKRGRGREKERERGKPSSAIFFETMKFRKTFLFQREFLQWKKNIHKKKIISFYSASILNQIPMVPVGDDPFLNQINFCSYLDRKVNQFIQLYDTMLNQR